MKTQGFFYLVDKKKLEVLYSGRLPASWGNIPSVDELSVETLKDLSWAGQPNLGFLLEADARAVKGMSQTLINTHKQVQCDEIWEQIKLDRDARKAGGVSWPVNGKEYWFWTDEPTRTQYSLLVNFAARNKLGNKDVLDNWKTMSGEFVPMTVELLYQVIDAGILKEKAIFNMAQMHKQRLYSADNPDAYDWRSGWPPTYNERAEQLRMRVA